MAGNEVPKKKKFNDVGGFSLTAMTPKNVIEQQELFFVNDCKVNPTFEYSNPAATEKYRQLHGRPRDGHLELAKSILDSFIEVYGCESNYLQGEGDVLS